jgi:signal transduction histidine kinase
MARQVAHEIKNPLTPMKLSAQQIRSAFHDRAPEFPKILEEGTQAIIDEIGSLQRIATEFSAFARMPRRIVQEEDLNEIVRESARFYRGAEGAGAPAGTSTERTAPAEAGAGGGRVDVALVLAAAAPHVRVDRSELKRVLVNLIENAVQASAAGGHVRVTTEAIDDAGAGASPLDEAPPPSGFIAWSGRQPAGRRLALVRIEDSGSGIASEFRARLFEPNFSTKTNGTGLGLAICKGIVEDYGGAIRVASAAGRGTTVSVFVPAASERAGD